MNPRFLVCPHDEHLISTLGGRSLAPKITSLEEIPEVVDAVFRAGAHLHCLIIEIPLPLTTITFKEEWKDIPIALFVRSMGKLSLFIKQLPVVRKLNIRIYLPTAPEENCTDVRVLSSLGVETALVFSDKNVDWDLLSDVMSYAYFARAPHEPIAPFDYIQRRYNKHHQNDFSAVYFNDPHTYLHLNETGQVALTKEHLASGKFIAESIEELGDVESNQDYIEYTESWRKFFLDKDGCAYCPGWRVCLGKFSNDDKNNPGCRDFFCEMMDSIEHKSTLTKEVAETWQP